MSQSQSPSDVLKAEHQVILRVLGVLKVLLERAERGEFAAGSWRQCVEFFRLFADLCHHGKEEDLLFPVLEQRGIPREGGPIGVMLHEHTVGRRLVGEMAASIDGAEKGDAQSRDRCLSAARQYIEMLTGHIYKEDNILFAMGDRVMKPTDQASLCESFGEVGCRAFAGRRREELEALADALCDMWAGPSATR